jgi:formylglycine-generating enzyme required for sulfatase activity
MKHVCRVFFFFFGFPLAVLCAQNPKPGFSQSAQEQIAALRLAIQDLVQTYGSQYPRGQQYLKNLEELAHFESAVEAKNLQGLKREALLDNPLLDFEEFIVLKRLKGQLGLPANHKCNAGLEQSGYDNEIAILELSDHQRLRTLYRPSEGEYVGEIDLNFDGDSLLFTQPNGVTWQLHEIKVDGTGLRRITPGDHTDVDSFDGCYLPDGRIIFASTASFHAVPCWHGAERACSLYQIQPDGTGIRQLCFDQDLDLHPSVLPTGQIIFSRWDYSGTMHMYLRPLMVMNPDGTGQRAVYGSNSYWPNALYFPRGIPGSANKIVAVIAGYHGPPRMGELGIIDLTKGWYRADGVIQRIPHRGEPIITTVRDNLVGDSWPKFLHPYPLSEKYFLVAAQMRNNAPWGIYLVDIFDNVLPLQVSRAFDFFEPIPLRKTPNPPVIPDRVDLDRDDAVVYLHDVYKGPGLKGVPRGTIKSLRVGAYHFGYPGMAGPDKVGLGGPWEVMRILGTVPVLEDGSTVFRVPANTPLTVQPLDEEGQAVQLMRSWFTAMPGEVVSCVGCHEEPRTVPSADYKAASTRPPLEITPWYGPARGFDFEREVQPVLTQYCVGCHNGQSQDSNHRLVDLRSEKLVKGYKGRLLAELGKKRLHPEARVALGGAWIKYTPAYEALLPYVRRVGIEDEIGLLNPGEYHANTSELIQMLRGGHYGVELGKEAWDRLITWIDLNAPCHGTYQDICPVPENADERRWELATLYGKPQVNPEIIPAVAHMVGEVGDVKSKVENLRSKPEDEESKVQGLKSKNRYESRSVQASNTQAQVPKSRSPGTKPQVPDKLLQLGDGAVLKFIRVSGGRMQLESDETVIIPSFWISQFEITNAQYLRFDPTHRSGHFAKRYPGTDGPGISMDDPNQPVIRVSWNEAMAFCDWLSGGTGLEFTLPTKTQWEFAGRAASEGAFWFADAAADFSGLENFADLSLSRHPPKTGGLDSSLTAHLGTEFAGENVFASDIICDIRFDDGSVATAPVGSYSPNPWGLYDVLGNAAEWTRSIDGSRRFEPGERRIVAGGSFHDRPERSRFGVAVSYPSWQRVHNVGFRVICLSGEVWTSRLAVQGE